MLAQKNFQIVDIFFFGGCLRAGGLLDDGIIFFGGGGRALEDFSVFSVRCFRLRINLGLCQSIFCDMCDVNSWRQ